MERKRQLKKEKNDTKKNAAVLDEEGRAFILHWRISRVEVATAWRRQRQRH